MQHHGTGGFGHSSAYRGHYSNSVCRNGNLVDYDVTTTFHRRSRQYNNNFIQKQSAANNSTAVIFSLLSV